MTIHSGAVATAPGLAPRAVSSRSVLRSTHELLLLGGAVAGNHFRPPRYYLSMTKPGVMLLASSIAFAQVSFDVVSVKPSPPQATGRSLTNRPGAGLSASNATLKMLIFQAYQVMPYQVTGGPEWISSEGFDIEARADNSKATPEHFREMLRRFLADRFQLKVHRATKELPVYTLAIAKGGAKLTESPADTAETGMRNEGGGRMSGVHATMQMFTTTLTRVLQRKVVDDTGRTGTYTFRLQFAPDRDPPSDNPGPSIFTAIQEQLGLTLKSGRGPVEVLIVDQAQKPAAN